MLRRGAKPSREAPAAAVSNGLKSGLGSRIVREDKEVNNTTEHEVRTTLSLKTCANPSVCSKLIHVPHRDHRRWVFFLLGKMTICACGVRGGG